MARINEHYLKLKAGYLFPEIARRVDAYVEAHPDRAGRIIKCGIGDVTEPLPEAVRDAMKQAVDDLGRRETFHGYGPPTGYDFIRQPIAQQEYRDRGIDVADDEVFLSDGSKIDCSAILDILALGRDENTFAIADPVYPVYVDSNVMAGHTGPANEDGRYEGLVYLPATPDNDFVPDTPDRHVDVIYLCYPNNPTGGTITHEQLRKWVDYAREHDATIMYDAAYEAYISDPSLPRSIFEIDGARSCAIEYRSFSKNGGFTGVRCGFTVVPKDLAGTTPDGQRVGLHGLWSRRWATKSNGVSYPVQRGAAALYSDEGRAQVRELIEHYLGNARILREACESLGLEVHGGVNAPYVWVRCPEGATSWDMFDRLLEEANVVITPGAGFGRMGEGFFRISAFNSRDNVEEVTKRMKAMSLEAVGK